MGRAVSTLSWLLGPLLLVLIAFGRSLSQGFAPIDDSLLIVENLAIRGVTLENLRTILTTFDPELYIPLVFASFQLDYTLGGLNPWIFHLTNILLHAVNAALVAWLLLLLTQKRGLSLLGGFIFAVHPLHTEAVVWIAGRKDLLSTLFYLLTCSTYIHYRSGKRAVYAASLLCAFLALLSKAMAVTLPAVLLLYDVLIEKRPLDRRLILDKIPYVLLSILFIGIATFGKERVIASSSLLETILMAGKSTIFYVQQFFVPLRFSLYYPHRGVIALSDPQFLIPLVLILCTIAIALRFIRRASWLPFGLAFYLITLSPTFPNFHKGAAMFFAVDRYAYLPSIGILFLLVTALAKFSEKFRAAKPGPHLASVLLLVLLTVFSLRQSRVWDSAESLFSHALTLYPESINARVDLARLYREQGKEEEAFTLLKEGLRYGDDLYLRIAAGAVYAKIGQIADAREQFERAREMDPRNPDPVFALGSLYEQIGEEGRARALFEEAVQLDPSFVIARVRLGKLYEDEKRPAEAEEQYRAALDWNPNSFDAHLAHGSLLLRIGNFEDAEQHLRKAEALRAYDHDVQSFLEKIRSTRM
jgi:tetratricopeptide (TPR) repeat protein